MIYPLENQRGPQKVGGLVQPWKSNPSWPPFFGNRLVTPSFTIILASKRNHHFYQFLKWWLTSRVDVSPFPSCFSFRFHGLISFWGSLLQDAPGADPYKWSNMGSGNFTLK